jgi:murein DD-endopeptidase MepM/ murein hydrolase activator NlpD
MAMTSGTVTLAEQSMYYEGGLVFIDHGMGLLSAYLHLSQINVKSGDEVNAQQIIGQVGSAGRSTGPHLDWRVYWRDQRLDPALLVSGEN